MRSIDAWERSQRVNYDQSLFTATGDAKTVWYTKTGMSHDFATIQISMKCPQAIKLWVHKTV